VERWVIWYERERGQRVSETRKERKNLSDNDILVVPSNPFQDSTTRAQGLMAILRMNRDLLLMHLMIRDGALLGRILLGGRWRRSMGLVLRVLVVRVSRRTPQIAHSRTDRKNVCLSFVVLPKPKLDEHILPIMLVQLRGVRWCSGEARMMLIIVAHGSRA
jgi:hypothetical protein